MNRTVYFADRAVAFTAEAPGGAWYAVAAEACGGISRAKLLNFLESHHSVAVLPKGHLECGARIEECAAREFDEETGVAARGVRPLCETLHAYYFPKTARWELKRTHWYELHAPGCAGLTPQTEEGIDSAVWCAPREVADNLRDAFPTIRCVAAAMGRN